MIVDELCAPNKDNTEWREQSCSVEIHFQYEKDKHQLTKVYFNHDLDV